MKILLGTVNIASQFGEMKNAFEELGHQVTIYLNDFPNSIIASTDYSEIAANYIPGFFRNNLFPSTNSIALKALRKPFSDIRKKFIQRRTKERLESLINDHDLFIFIWDSLLPDYSDLEMIKEAGKKIIFIFCGDDVRWYFATKQEFEGLGMKPIQYDSSYFYGARSLEYRLKRISAAEKYADIIYSKREQAQLQSRPFYHWRMFVDTKNYTCGEQTSNEKKLVIHAPTNPTVKGTKYVLDAIERIKLSKVNFDFILLQNMNVTEVQGLLKKADIVIDQLQIPGGGRLTTEALASGADLLTYMNYKDYDQGIEYQRKPECPIIDCSIDNVYEVLSQSIQSKEIGSKRSENHQYTEKHLDVRKMCEGMMRNISDTPDSFDYFPYFYKSSFKPESRLAENLYKRYLG